MDISDASQLAQFKLKRLIRQLESVEGSGTSMITCIIAPGKKISDLQKNLTEESGKAERIKDRANRQGVIKSISTVKEKLKLMGDIPPNGYFIFSGEVVKRGGKSTSRMIVCFEPFKPINTMMYKCASAFDTTQLRRLLIESDKYGFIIIDGSGCFFGTLQGNHKEKLLQFGVDLPKKHGRGGQSAPRFGRIRLEKRAAYVRKVCEAATPLFITDDKPNIAGIIIAGYADFKNLTQESAFFDQRLKAIVVNLVDISYGGEQGFNQAIEASKSCFANLKLVQEQEIIGAFYENINLDTGKIAYGIQDTMSCLGDGSIEKLIVWDNLDTIRCEVIPKDSETMVVKYFTSEELDNLTSKGDEDMEFELLDEMPLVDWLAENVGSFGAELIYVTDQSPEGSQFVAGFGGIAAFLRFQVDIEQQYYFDDEEEDDMMDFI